MNITQIKRFEKKLSDLNNIAVMKDENGNQFVQHMYKFYVLQKLDNFKDFEPVASRWFQLFFNSKNKFPLVLWNTTLKKMYKIALQILLLVTDDGLLFSLGFLSILVNSRELNNIEHFYQDLNKFITILAKLYKHVFSTGVFHHQRLFFKLVYDMILQLDQEYKLQLLRNIFNARLIKQILQIDAIKIEENLRYIINQLNKNSDVFKSFAIIAKSIKIGHTIFTKSIFDEMWIDFNIIVMEISFYLNNNGNSELINIPISSIYDITIVNDVEAIINIALNSNKLTLESGAYYTINGGNYITITCPHGNNTNTLINYIIPEYLKSIHDNTQVTTNNDSNKIIVNSELLAYETESSPTVLEFNHSAEVINDSQEVADSVLVTNGLYESFKKSTIESDSQTKNIIVQRVQPLQKPDDTIVSTNMIPESQPVLIHRLRYRDIYSEATPKISTQSGRTSVGNTLQQHVPYHRSQHVDGRLLVIQYDSRLKDNQEKIERLNNWLDMTLQNTKRARNAYEGSNSCDDIIELKKDTMNYEVEPLFLAPSKNSRQHYFLRSTNTRSNMYVKQDLEKLNAEFGKQLCNLVEDVANKFNNPRKIFIENKIKRLKIKQYKKLTKSVKEISEAVNSIHEANNKIQKLRHKVTNKLDHQTRRIRRYKETFTNRLAEIKELDSKKEKNIKQFKTKLIITAESSKKQIWNNYILNLSRHVQNNFLKKLF